MLPKRSTLVDQNLGSESIHFPLSVAIFIVSRNLLVAQETFCCSGFLSLVLAVEVLSLKSWAAMDK